MNLLWDAGQYWVAGNCTSPTQNSNCSTASSMLGSELENLIPQIYGYEIRFETDTINLSENRINKTLASHITVSSRFVTGLHPNTNITTFYLEVWQ